MVAAAVMTETHVRADEVKTGTCAWCEDKYDEAMARVLGEKGARLLIPQKRR